MTESGLRELLAKGYGPTQSGERVPEIPRLEWVQTAIECFESLRWVERKPDHGGEFSYIVKYRRKPMDQFIGFCAAARVREEAAAKAKEKKILEAPTLPGLPVDIVVERKPETAE